MRSLTLVLLMLLMTSCSAMSLVKDAFVGSKSGVRVDTELVLGNKKEEVDTDVQLGDKQTAGVINNNQKEEVPLFVWLLMILGWILPSPKEIYKEVKAVMGSIFKKGVVK